ncbi:methyl-accepting chemotaxis protein [Brassicibacter mesophilus]|uniref:methyl-accepting chemotaxis protein n=1 Tax=Brassicibacter mesophilus TaxID=745119 RepID=UPI003D1CE1BA
MNLAVVGAGKGGTNIINSLSSLEDININIVVDTNLNAPGIVLAKQLGIKYSKSLDDISNENVHMIIEATGLEKVTSILTNKYSDKCKIIDSHGALLIMSLVEKDMITLEKMNKQISAINDTSNLVQHHLKDICSSIESIHIVTEKLLTSTEASNTYISESDKVVKYVNKIANQIKILGLNANIEAARAGEYGKGFAVVAKEVQNLAGNSEKFASEINDILGKLSVEISNISKVIENLDTLSQIQIESSQLVSTAIDTLKKETVL